MSKPYQWTHYEPFLFFFSFEGHFTLFMVMFRHTKHTYATYVNILAACKYYKVISRDVTWRCLFSRKLVLSMVHGRNEFRRWPRYWLNKAFYDAALLRKMIKVEKWCLPLSHKVASEYLLIFNICVYEERQAYNVLPWAVKTC